MKQIDVFSYAEQLTRALPEGILLNTNGEKFNSMVIGWGHLGVIWGKPTFTVYVRQSRYTKAQIDRTGEFTLSAPVRGVLPPRIMEICGSRSGRDVDKAEEAGLTVAGPYFNHTPGIVEAPLTLECRAIYRQDQVVRAIPAEIQSRYYAEAGAEDFHAAYIGEIIGAYLLD